MVYKQTDSNKSMMAHSGIYFRSEITGHYFFVCEFKCYGYDVSINILLMLFFNKYFVKLSYVFQNKH